MKKYHAKKEEQLDGDSKIDSLSIDVVSLMILWSIVILQTGGFFFRERALG